MKREVMRAKIVGMKKKPLKESEKRRPEKWYSMKKDRAMRRERERERKRDALRLCKTGVSRLPRRLRLINDYNHLLLRGEFCVNSFIFSKHPFSLF